MRRAGARVLNAMRVGMLNIDPGCDKTALDIHTLLPRSRRYVFPLRVMRLPEQRSAAGGNNQEYVLLIEPNLVTHLTATQPRAWSTLSVSCRAMT